MLRSYILASDTAHYDAVIRAFEAQGLRRAARLCRGAGRAPGD
jgi:magnesium chelatase subunit H